MLTRRTMNLKPKKEIDTHQIPIGLVVRIPGFHPGGPGSIPGLGDFFLLTLSKLVGYATF